jgi:hypothetical protein
MSTCNKWQIISTIMTDLVIIGLIASIVLLVILAIAHDLYKGIAKAKAELKLATLQHEHVKALAQMGYQQKVVRLSTRALNLQGDLQTEYKDRVIWVLNQEGEIK